MPSPRSRSSINGFAADALKLSQGKVANINAADVLWLYGAFSRLVTAHEKLRGEHEALKKHYEIHVKQSFTHGQIR